MINRSDALQLVDESFDDLTRLSDRQAPLSEMNTWAEKAKIIVRHLEGDDSQLMRDIEAVTFSPMTPFLLSVGEDSGREAINEGVMEAKKVLHRLRQSILSSDRPD